MNTVVRNESELSTQKINVESDKIIEEALEAGLIIHHSQSLETTVTEDNSNFFVQKDLSVTSPSVVNNKDCQSAKSVSEYLHWPENNILQPKSNNRRKKTTSLIISGSTWQHIEKEKENEKLMKIESSIVKRKIKKENQAALKIEREEKKKKREKELLAKEQNKI